MQLQPKGKHASKAKRKITTLKKIEKELNYWQNARQINTIKSYQNYLAQYPKGKYKDIAKQRISQIEAKEKSKKSEFREKWLGIIGSVVMLFLLGGGAKFVYNQLTKNKPIQNKVRTDSPSKNNNGTKYSLPNKDSQKPNQTTLNTNKENNLLEKATSTSTKKNTIKPSKKIGVNVSLIDNRNPKDRKIYKTVNIDGKVWMAENLQYKMEGAECLGNNITRCQSYGLVYTNNAARKACPIGWSLPSEADWKNLLSKYNYKNLIEGGKSGLNIKSMVDIKFWTKTVDKIATSKAIHFSYRSKMILFPSEMNKSKLYCRCIKD